MVYGYHPDASPPALCVGTLFGLTATSTSTIAPVAQLLGKLRRVGHEARGLLHRVAILICTTVLPLITHGLDDAVVAHDTLDETCLPRAGTSRMIMQKMPARRGLNPLQLNAELEVLLGIFKSRASVQSSEVKFEHLSPPSLVHSASEN